MTNLEAFKNLYVAEGGYPLDVKNMTETSEVVDALAGVKAITAITCASPTANTEYWGTKVSAMQTGVTVSATGAVTGTLKFIEGGIAPGTLSGDGNFLALKFTDSNSADSIKVGLVPSATGMGLQELDSDMDAVFKISSKSQVIKIVTTKGDFERVQTLDLSGLTLNTEA